MKCYSAGQDVAVIPKIGRVLVFQHDILHEGSLLVQGTKYSMRTDIMYKAVAQGVKAENKKGFYKLNSV